MNARWPVPADAADPWPEPWPPPEERPELCRRIDAVFAGHESLLEVARAARAAGLDEPLRFDDRRWPAAPYVPTATHLARLVADVTPGVGNEAPDRFLGPWADERLPRRVLEVTLALTVFIPVDESDKTAFQTWANRKPVPPVDERRALRALDRMPLAPWHLDAATPDGRWRVTSGLPLGPASTVDGPVSLHDPGCWPSDAPAPGRWLLARIIRGPDGWAAPGALLVPGPVDPTPWSTWLRLIVWSARAEGYDATVDELLRSRGHLVARRILEQAWETDP